MEKIWIHYYFYKKNETGKIVYLVCNKRGKTSKLCTGKERFFKDSSKIENYENCIDNKLLHDTINYEDFYQIYISNEFSNIDMKLWINQKYFADNKVQNYVDWIEKFNIRFNNIKFILNEDCIRKIKASLLGAVNNKSIFDICDSLKNNNKDLIVNIYPISIEYKKHNNIEKKDQKIIIIGHKNMIKQMDNELCSQYGIDFTFEIIPKNLKPYKLMSIYAINKNENKSLIACLILFKYDDADSLKKIFSLLRATFNFSPIYVTVDFDSALHYALKNCNLFKKTYVISYFFHFSHSLMKKLKDVKIIKKIKQKRNWNIKKLPTSMFYR